MSTINLGVTENFPLRSDLVARLLREASPVGNITTSTPTGFATNTPSAVTAGALNPLLNSICPMGFLWVVEEITVALDRAGMVFAQWGISNKPNAYDANRTFVGSAQWGGGAAGFHVVGSAGGSKTWRFDGQLYVQEGGYIGGGYAMPTTAGGFCTWNASVIQITNDLDWDAKNVICVAGDSITSIIPSTASAVGANLYPMILTEALRDLGVSVRLVNKGVPGSTSYDGARWLQDGRYAVDYDFLIVAYGMNDAQAGIATPQATYTANLNAYITHRNRHRPAADVLILGPSYTDDANRSTIASYRTWAQAVVTAAQTGQPSQVTGGVYYLDLNSIATVPSTDFVEAAGSRVHPSIAGHAKLAAGVLTAVQATKWYLRARAA